MNKKKIKIFFQPTKRKIIVSVLAFIILVCWPLFFRFSDFMNGNFDALFNLIAVFAILGVMLLGAGENCGADSPGDYCSRFQIIGV